MKRKIKNSRPFLTLLLLTGLFFVCQFTLKGVGAGSSEKNAALLTLFIILLSFSPVTFWYIAFPIFFLMALYTPIGLVFGLPTYQSIASVISTNLTETEEFFSQFSLYNLFYPVGLLLIFIAVRTLYVKSHLTLHSSKLLLVVFLVLSLFNLPAGIFYRDLADAVIKLKKEGVEIAGYKNEWGAISATESGYDRYVVVIGESVRADYINALGYPLNNTPFMSSHGLSVKGLISGGSNTVASLSNMLTRSVGGEPDYTKNIIDLANGAGFETWWLSNQGFISEVDTPVSMIANLSAHKKFIKYGAFNSKNTSDFMLVPLLRDVVNQPLRKKEFIVIHLYGSHPKPCARVDDFDGGFYSDKPELNNVACYVNSIKKTDKILSEFNNILQASYRKSGISYSMVYFSDHGLAHELSGDKINLLHGESIHTYSVPLFQISSDSRERKLCESDKSGLKMTEGLAHWAGIKNSHLDGDYSLFDCKDDPTVKGYVDQLKTRFRPDLEAIAGLHETFPAGRGEPGT